MKRALPLLLAALASCGGPPASGPVPVAWGEDTCGVCRMILSEPPFAAQARFGAGRVELFDDLGCLAERLSKGPAPLEVWVADRGTSAWIDGRRAAFVRVRDLKTPMASGLAAYRTREEAEKAGHAPFPLADLGARGRP
jgi:copper chaperone NosL